MGHRRPCRKREKLTSPASLDHYSIIRNSVLRAAAVVEGRRPAIEWARTCSYIRNLLYCSMPDDGAPTRPLRWMGDSRKQIGRFPEPVKDEMGYALWIAQQSGKHRSAKPLKGFKGA